MADTVVLDLEEMLGASESASGERLTLYIPSRDRAGSAFNPAPWIDEALMLLSKIGGGATVEPVADGAWLDPETGKLLREKIILIYTHIDPERFARRLVELRAFLHRMGRDTFQGEVVLEFSGRMYKIRNYDL